MVFVRLTDPMLNGDIYGYLAGSLPATVREVQNVVTVEFTDARPVDEQLEAVRRITSAWHAAGHLDVGTRIRAG
jgi:hypothetical protein